MTENGSTTPTDVYEGFVAEFYDYVGLHETRPDTAFYVETARSWGGPVLELGCGTGRILLPTAREGIEITGVDGSEPMLERLRDRLAEEPEDVRGRIQVVMGDLRSFEAPGTFRLITCPFRPLQHLHDVDGQVAFMNRVHDHLAPGGRFVFDVFDPDLAILTTETPTPEFGHEDPFQLPDGRGVVRAHRVLGRDLATQVNHINITYYVSHPDGRTEQLVHDFRMRHFFRYEIEHLLARAGLAIETLYGDFDRTPYGEGVGGEMIFVCRRDDE